MEALTSNYVSALALYNNLYSAPDTCWTESSNPYSQNAFISAAKILAANKVFLATIEYAGLVVASPLITQPDSFKSIDDNRLSVLDDIVKKFKFAANIDEENEETAIQAAALFDSYIVALHTKLGAPYDQDLDTVYVVGLECDLPDELATLNPLRDVTLATPTFCGYGEIPPAVEPQQMLAPFLQVASAPEPPQYSLALMLQSSSWLPPEERTPSNNDTEDQAEEDQIVPNNESPAKRQKFNED